MRLPGKYVIHFNLKKSEFRIRVLKRIINYFTCVLKCLACFVLNTPLFNDFIVKLGQTQPLLSIFISTNNDNYLLVVKLLWY